MCNFNDTETDNQRLKFENKCVEELIIVECRLFVYLVFRILCQYYVIHFTTYAFLTKKEKINLM